MTTTEQTTVEQMNRVIAEFMGLTVIPSGTKAMGVINHPEIPEAFLKYHSSWDWQIPVWSKLAKEIKQWVTTRDRYEIQKYFRFIGKYEEHVFNNEPEKGIEIIYEMLNWYNEHSKK